MPARRRADLGRNARVETQPAMALGASVQPFTRAKVKTSVGKKIFISNTIPPFPTVFKEYDFYSLFNNFWKKYLSLIDIEM